MEGNIYARGESRSQLLATLELPINNYHQRKI